MMKPLHIHTRAQNHPDKQKSYKSRYMSRIGLLLAGARSNKHNDMNILEVTIARKVLPHPQGMAPAQFAE
jgi:hypothetical protein